MEAGGDLQDELDAPRRPGRLGLRHLAAAHLTRNGAEPPWPELVLSSRWHKTCSRLLSGPSDRRAARRKAPGEAFCCGGFLEPRTRPSAALKWTAPGPEDGPRRKRRGRSRRRPRRPLSGSSGWEWTKMSARSLPINSAFLSVGTQMAHFHGRFGAAALAMVDGPCVSWSQPRSRPSRAWRS